MTRKINLIVIHCSATRSNQRFTVEMLKACHNARFNGKGIGYHYFIEKDGQVFQTATRTRSACTPATITPTPSASVTKEDWTRKAAPPTPALQPSALPSSPCSAP